MTCKHCICGGGCHAVAAWFLMMSMLFDEMKSHRPLSSTPIEGDQLQRSFPCSTDTQAMFSMRRSSASDTTHTNHECIFSRKGAL